ncbi:uncharacterized protein [Pyxicephalus adspersus]|uniref:uncharacterized protein isoform X3 n=2 Tax=Pyxicephalus adspersus TaxID=30357 RepID=UPI003B59DD8A
MTHIGCGEPGVFVRCITFLLRPPNLRMGAHSLYQTFWLLSLCGMDQARMQLKGFYDLIDTPAGSSILLPTMYIVHRENWNGFSPSFRWQHNGSLILFFSGENCSLASGGFFQNCSGKPFIMGRKDSDILFFPENASLMLHNVQTRDSGLYKLDSRYTTDSVLIILNVEEYKTIDQGTYMNFILMTVLTPAAKVIFTALFLYLTWRRTLTS